MASLKSILVFMEKSGWYNSAVNFVGETLHDAFTPVIVDEKYVSRKGDTQSQESHADGVKADGANGAKTGEVHDKFLESSNHALHLGKISRAIFSVRDRIRRMLTSDKKVPTYSTEFIEASLDYLFKHAKKGEKVQVIVYRVLSEIFNGPEDVADTLSTEEEIERIYTIAAKKFKKHGSALEVVNIEKQPEHQEFFQTLRSAIDPATGVINVQKALDVEELPQLSAPPTSLQIAQYLYRAVHEHDVLRKAIMVGVPSRLKSFEPAKGEEPEKTDDRKGYYALTEIAIRLSQVLSGRTIHAGASRQAYYDEPLIKLLKGKNGPFRAFPTLFPLYEKFEHAKFGTLHIDNQNNPVMRKSHRQNAIGRLATVTALAAGVPGSCYGLHALQDHRRHEAAKLAEKAELQSKAGKHAIFIDSHIAMEREKNGINIDYYVKEALQQMHQRFNIPQELDEDLRPLLKEFLFEEEYLSLEDFMFYPDYRAMFVNRFLQKRRLYLASKGVELGRPFAKLLPYKHLITAAAQEDDTYSIDTQDYTCAPNVEFCRNNFQEIGIISISSYMEDTVGVDTDPFHKHHFLALDTSMNRQFGHGRYFSARRGREVAQDFINAQRSYDLANLLPYDLRMHSLDSGHFDPQAFEEKHEAFDSCRDSEITYKDFFDVFEYRLIQSHAKKEGDFLEPVFFARTPDESHYTLARAVEASKYYEWARWPSLHSLIDDPYKKK